MTVQEAIAQAEVILPVRATSEGTTDRRWQAVIAVAEFIETDPEVVWSFILRWGSSEDEDLRMAIATCALEHHFDGFISRIELTARENRLFAKTVSLCWKFGQAEEPSRAARLEQLNASLRRLAG